MNTCAHCLNRRQFLSLASGGLAGAAFSLTPALAAGPQIEPWDPLRPFLTLGRKLKLQPLFMYSLPTRREQTSWRSWGGVQSESAVAEEVARITKELQALAAKARFPLEILPVAKINTVEAAKKAGELDYDVTLLYASTGGGGLLRACLSLKPDTLVFVRHQSGYVYYWYEALSTRYLQTSAAAPAASTSTEPLNVHVDDVVVDDYDALLWRLRALFALVNFRGARIVALGGPMGKYAPDAPQLAQQRFGLKILTVSYDDFAPRLQRARADRDLVVLADHWARQYLALPNTRLETDRKFVVNAFILYRLFKDLMAEHQASAFTIQNCMSTIIPMAETTACLTLGLLNDEGLIAFCESDFVIIPPGLLLRYICGQPVFLHNSTFPHERTVTCAHCTSPRRMDAKRYEPARILTHYESDYGAAPKVEFPIGQLVTFLDPEYSTPRWLGFKGTIKSNPFYAICRSQQDVQIQGDWKLLLNEARDSHWVMAYGDHLKEAGYAVRKLGLQWVLLSNES